MSVICTALPKVEVSIAKYEDHLKESQIKEEEVHYGDQGQPDSREGADDDIQMESSGEGEESNPPEVDSPSHPSSLKAQPQVEADTEGTQSVASGGNITVSAKKEEILTGDQTSQWPQVATLLYHLRKRKSS